MGSSEVAVRYALEELKRTGTPITRERVAEIAQCSTVTVSRVFAVMRNRGQLLMEGTPRSGYKYTLNSTTDRRHEDDR